MSQSVHQMEKTKTAVRGLGSMRLLIILCSMDKDMWPQTNIRTRVERYLLLIGNCSFSILALMSKFSNF